MKSIFTLMILVAAFAQSNAQAILNEVYAFPGGSRNEFFEFYNNSTSTGSMDNYTVVTYYEEGTTEGFFVLDLPNISIAPGGYFVGSSAIPFNYQGVSNSYSSNYSWNDLAFMAANNAYLRRWELKTTVPVTDGNASYDMVPIPANYNDIFQKIGGGDATYNVFVFKNGTLLSVFLGGTGGNTFIPNYIVGLPTLHVDMSGTAPDFDIDFSNINTVSTEYVIQDIGSDNGYIRLVDGYCGTWTKSSSQVTHTPGVTNGGDPETVESVVSVSSAVVRGSAATGSTINYDVVGAVITDFPITMHLYIDNGTVAGELDPGDTYLDTKVEYSVSDGGFSNKFFPYDAHILIQTVTSAGCIDGLRFIPNLGVLPVRITGFQAMLTSNNTELRWQVADNEAGKVYEVQKSTNGKDFYAEAHILSTAKAGVEQYMFRAEIPGTKTFYRIKLVDQNNKISFSSIQSVGGFLRTSGNLSLNQNPVESYLLFDFRSAENTLAQINIYNASGAVVHHQKINLTNENNTVAINLDGKLFTGIYILEIKTPTERNSVKFIKR